MLNHLTSTLPSLSLTVLLVASTATLQAQKRGPDVLIVADNFGHDITSTRPTKDRPVYYVYLGGAQRDIGASIAGERMPRKDQLEAALDAALASQNFRRTQVGGPVPDIVLLYSFGSANLNLMEWSEDEFDADSGELTGTNDFSYATDAREMRALVGAAKVQNRMLSPAEAADLNDAITTDRIYILLAALDAREASKKNPKIMWRTRISIPSVRNSLPKALDMMLASAAPFFGADSEAPVFIGDRDRRKTDVQIGETEVVDENVP